MADYGVTLDQSDLMLDNSDPDVGRAYVFARDGRRCPHSSPTSRCKTCGDLDGGGGDGYDGRGHGDGGGYGDGDGVGDGSLSLTVRGARPARPATKYTATVVNGRVEYTKKEGQ